MTYLIVELYSIAVTVSAYFIDWGLSYPMIIYNFRFLAIKINFVNLNLAISLS